ncbi:MAG TPA: efflux RND transporter periplasmic adaptor subunit [Kofleriaceae bacterium]|nr:efflux RND transporter periplasmic adaptor subunit [Kofleriaceae bacterium]
MKLVVLLFSLIAAGCARDDGGRANPAGSGAPAIEVGVVTIQPTRLTLTRELPGRTSAFRIAEVRARVNGIVQKRLFVEGSDVKANQPLFWIDPAPYEAVLESARAQVVRAEATLESAKSLAERYEKLLATNAVSRQEYEDAVAKAKGAIADLAAARAAVKAAQINVDYTLVRAPIAGRIGRSEVTEGAYVQQAQATLLATVQQLDKLYVDLTWSSGEVMKLREELEGGQLEGVTGEAKVTIVLENGRDYPVQGTLQFADAKVDETTGSIALRATVPNPKLQLLPGMFVRARIDEGVKPDALLVPQRAVTRDQNGRAITNVALKDGRVERRVLETDRAVGDSWLVTKGLAPGDQVVVEGLQRLRPGVTVKAVPAGQGAGSGSAVR